MSSLWSLMKKGRVGFVAPFSDESATEWRLKAFEPRLINANTYFESYWETYESTDFSMEKMDGTPIFPTLWVEWRHDNRRNAVYVVRETPTTTTMDLLEAPADAKFHIRLMMFDEQDGRPVLRAGAQFHIDRMGSLCGRLAVTSSQGNRGPASFHMLFCCDLLTTINTHGTRIEPPWNSKPARVIKPDRAPCSVWHEVLIPKFQGPPLVNAEITPEILERREHWVRAHRKDYRRGAGMFGRVKALVWVPEFTRGNPELGTVKQSYEVHAQ